ncbi:hypothetical protein CRE_18767 [Caenorhabditis remanei]|uniref:Uncharacterized protein n=1 Tax=Caenorhabditis remanei TaxID=31234 RepID=E3LK41_CAERE|nr:hypothetical protein CRE_18767 [Caenorhabditis remanei]
MADKYADENIVFDKKNPQPAAHYIAILTKFFNEIAPNATQKQKDTLTSLGKSTIMVGIANINKINQKSEIELDGLKKKIDGLKEKLHTADLAKAYSLNKALFHTKNNSHQKIDNEAKKEEYEKIDEEIRRVSKDADAMSEEFHNNLMDHKEKLKMMEYEHQINVAEYKKKIESIKIQLMMK